MAVEHYTIFKATTNINETLLTNEVELNLKAWMRWALLKIGAWQDVEMDSSGYYGGNFHELTAIEDPSYSDYQVWETPKKDIVHETGVDFNDQEPIEISGVWVNGSFYAPGHATYGHYVDYPNGRVVFNAALDSDDVVKMNYSYRTVSVEIADDSPLWKEIQYGSLRVDNTHRTDPDKGQWSAIPSLKRQQLPAIIIEAVPRGSNKGWEIGSQALMVNRDVLFHIVAEDRLIRNNLVDIVALEENKTIWMFNSDDLVNTDDWPLDYRGAKNTNGLTYPNLIENYKWLRLTILKTLIAEVGGLNPYLHEGTVRATCEIILTKD